MCSISVASACECIFPQSYENVRHHSAGQLRPRTSSLVWRLSDIQQYSSEVLQLTAGYTH